jgi:hypothetical protein
LACFLYCVTLANRDPIPNLIGVAERPVVWHDFGELRVYWSEVANPETLLAGAPRKPAEFKYQQVLREIVIRTTAIAFPFPAVVADLKFIDAVVGEQREYYLEALTRLDGTVQYELTATWAEDMRADLATPVKGREYLKRRQETEARVAAIEAKLRTVTNGIVREWRSRQERRKHLWFALLERGDRERFIAALRSAGSSEGVRLRLSGPWPSGEFVRAQP